MKNIHRLAEDPNTWKADLPADHEVRMERVRLSLDGLGLGDSIGQLLFGCLEMAPRFLARNRLPRAPWRHTDDTEMAISIASVLKSYGIVHQEALAEQFVQRFERDPHRGYGGMTFMQMSKILAGARWQDTAREAFGGQGSMGNGSAMRIPPLGAYFADDLVRCAAQARDSSVVTHTHPEGVAGAIAAAIAAAMAWQLRDDRGADRASRFFDGVLRHTPEGQVRRGLLLAQTTPAETPLTDVARFLGNGSLVTCPDTVPFCVWMAAHHLDDFVGALGKTVSVGGDCDTTAAIVCGIVALSVGRNGLPTAWLEAREPVTI